MDKLIIVPFTGSDPGAALAPATCSCAGAIEPTSAAKNDDPSADASRHECGDSFGTRFQTWRSAVGRAFGGRAGTQVFAR